MDGQRVVGAERTLMGAQRGDRGLADRGGRAESGENAAQGGCGGRGRCSGMVGRLSLRRHGAAWLGDTVERGGCKRRCLRAGQSVAGRGGGRAGAAAEPGVGEITETLGAKSLPRHRSLYDVCSEIVSATGLVDFRQGEIRTAVRDAFHRFVRRFMDATLYCLAGMVGRNSSLFLTSELPWASASRICLWAVPDAASLRAYRHRHAPAALLIRLPGHHRP